MSPQFWWYLTRASGIVAWLMLTASIIWGIVLSTKAFPEQRRPAWLLDLHRWLGGLTVSFVAIHLAALVADSYVSFDLVDLLVPFASAWKPVPIAIGVVATVAARCSRGDLAAHEAPASPHLALDPFVELCGLPPGQPARGVRRHRQLTLAVPGDCRSVHRCRDVVDGVPPHPSQTLSPATPRLIDAANTSTHGDLMEIDTLFGLPAHPLVVHAAVVLLPIAAIGLIVVAAIPRARKLYAPIVLGLALAATVAVGLAQQSGESLEDDVKETELVEEHAEQGETVLPWAIAVTVMSALVAAEPYVRNRFDKPSPRVVTAVLVGASLIVGLGATYTVIDVGHSGAKSVWNDVGD